MPDLSYVLLYVDNPAASAAFYSDLLGLQPVEQSPTFALFVIKPGLKLGLWSRHTVEPAADGARGGATELALTVDDRASVDATHADWVKRGHTILQAPTEMDFGYTFTAADPDGHRLRVFVLTI